MLGPIFFVNHGMTNDRLGIIWYTGYLNGIMRHKYYEGRPHGLRPQGWPSPQDEALRGTAMLGTSCKLYKAGRDPLQTHVISYDSQYNPTDHGSRVLRRADGPNLSNRPQYKKIL